MSKQIKNSTKDWQFQANFKTTNNKDLSRIVSIEDVCPIMIIKSIILWRQDTEYVLLNRSWYWLLVIKWSQILSIGYFVSREWEKQQRLQAMVGRLQEMVEQETRARSAAAAERLGLPPSIQLPDGEYGQDAHLQLRVPYQVSNQWRIWLFSFYEFKFWVSDNIERVADKREMGG